MTRRGGSLVRRSPVGAFFVLAYALSWAFILPWSLSESAAGLGLLPYTLPDAYGIVMFVVAPLGPALAAVLGADPLTALLESWSLFFTVFLPLVLLGIFVPSIVEEPGWRGFALPRLQERYGPVRGTLVLGTLVGTYHTPGFFTPFLGPITLPEFVAFQLTAVAAAFIYTWVFNGSGGSLLIVILLHAAGNAGSGSLTPIFDELPYGGWAATVIDGGALNVAVFTTIAVALVVLTGGRLSYGRGEPPGS